MLKKNDEIICEVSSLGSNGEGVIKYEGFVIFVPFVLPKEKVKVKILKVQKNCAFGKLLEIIEESEDRISPTCPVFYKCGGCDIQHLSYDKQLDFKKTSVDTCFQKIARISVKINETVPCENVFRYRNKLQLPVKQTEDGTVIGFYAVNSHRVIPIKDCPINPKWTSDIISSFTQYFNEFSVCGYNEESGEGQVREITVKEINSALLITLVSLKKDLPNLDRLVEILKNNLNSEFSLFLNINNRNSNVIYGEEFKLIYGKKEYVAEMFGIKYNVGVLSFMQVNNYICQKLYSKVSEYLKPDENTTVIDAYSGAGLMTALLAKTAKHAIGIEIVKEAVDCANNLAKDNGFSEKITNYCGKCEEILPDIIQKERQNGNKIALVIDPPRKGCDIKVIDAIIKSDIERIVYVSCMPSTLARDIGLIVGTLEMADNQIKNVENPKPRYKIESVTPFDMFPQTKHVETLCVLVKI